MTTPDSSTRLNVDGAANTASGDGSASTQAAVPRVVQRRQRWLGVAVVAVVSGLTTEVLVLLRVNRELADEQAKVESRNKELADEQVKVQGRFDLAAKAIQEFHSDVSDEALLKNDQLTGLRTKLLKQAAGFYSDLEKRLAGQTDAKSLQTLSMGYFQLAELTEKIGSQKEALAAHRKGLALRRELAAAPGADVETRLDVARSLRMVGRLMLATGNVLEALQAFAEMRDIAAALEAESPTDAIRQQLAQSQYNIGLVQINSGKPAEALEAFSSAKAIRQKLVENNPANSEFQKDLAWSHLLIAQSLSSLGRTAEAKEEYGNALAIRQKLVAEHPAVNQYRVDLADTHIVIGDTMRRLGMTAESLEATREGLAITEKLVDDDPTVTAFQRNLAAIHRNIAEMLVTNGKLAEGLKSLRKALAVNQKLAENNPANTGLQHALANLHSNIGLTLLWMGKPVEALESLRRSLPIRQKLVDANPGNTDYQDRLATLHSSIGLALGRQKQFAEASTALDAGLAIRQKLADAHSKNTYYSLVLGKSYAYRGTVRARAGQSAESAADLRRALELWAKAPHPANEIQAERSQSLALLAGLGGDAKSGVTKDEAKTFADQSIAAIAAIVKLGWALPSELKEPDFDAVRGRADFQKLVAQVEARAEQPLETAPIPAEKK